MAEIAVKLKPWMVPNFVVLEQAPGLRQNGFDLQSVPIRDVPAETLSSLCDEWRAGVFAKAEKVDPKAGQS